MSVKLNEISFDSSNECYIPQGLLKIYTKHKTNSVSD